jgi:uncharacterized protein (TIGR03435 family)
MALVTSTGFELRGATMRDLSRALSNRIDRDMIDKTGITGVFEMNVTLPEAAAPAGSNDPIDPVEILGGVRIALQGIGLKIESAKGPGRFFVIYQVEKPSDN